VKCFQEICNCSCGDSNELWEATTNRELNSKLSLKELCHSNIGWFSDKSICDSYELADWMDSKIFGIYFLWHKDDYCPTHNLFHMKCLYVGKGQIKNRITRHFYSKDFSENMLVYFTYYDLPNRLSKYYEQLILDIFNVPFNKSENKGLNNLCMYFTQNEVD
jgi:hypothetical protein